jgi:RNA-binding protein
MPLSNEQRRFLRELAHVLKPVVMVGQRGVTEAVVQELDGALSHHELVKVKIASGDRAGRDADIDALLAASGAELVHCIGHVAAFYRPNADQPRLQLPR